MPWFICSDTNVFHQKHLVAQVFATVSLWVKSKTEKFGNRTSRPFQSYEYLAEPNTKRDKAELAMKTPMELFKHNNQKAD